MGWIIFIGITSLAGGNVRSSPARQVHWTNGRARISAQTNHYHMPARERKLLGYVEGKYYKAPGK